MISPGAAKAVRSLRLIGLIGFSVVLILNLAARFIVAQPAAVFFSDAWRATWFPSYLVWLVFLVIGFFTRRRG